jgi:hypothetical protein
MDPDHLISRILKLSLVNRQGRDAVFPLTREEFDNFNHTIDVAVADGLITEQQCANIFSGPLKLSWDFCK